MVDERNESHQGGAEGNNQGRKPIEDYAEEYVIMEKTARKGRSIKNFVTALTVVLVAVAFMAYIKNRDKFGVSPVSPQEIPVVEADKSPFKVAPADPGGMPIPNRDKKIYDAIETANRDNLPKVVKILPSPEEPVDIEKIIAIDESTAPEVSLNIQDTMVVVDNQQPNDLALDAEKLLNDKLPKENTTTDDIAKIIEAEEVTAPLVQNDQDIIIPDDIVVKKRPLPQKDLMQVDVNDTDIIVKRRPLSEKDLIKIKVIDPKDVKNINKKIDKRYRKLGDYRIQLGAFKTKEDAIRAFATIKRKNPDLIEGTESHVEKADLGEKGIFFRLQAGYFSNQQEARKVCAELRERKQGCFIVKVSYK